MGWMKLGLYFTTYTVLLTILSRFYVWPASVMDVLRGTVSIVALSIAYIYLRYGPKVVYQFYARFLGSNVSPALVWLYDVLIHFLPVVVVGGFPRHFLGLAVAYAIFIAWFLAIRSSVGLQSLYSPAIPKKDYDTWAFVFLPLILGVLWSVPEWKKMTSFP
jgi:hypothetical protein